MACLESDRLWLLPFALADLDYLHKLWTLPEVRRFLWDDEVISRQLAVEVITASQTSFDKFEFGFWRLILKENDRSTGFCGLRHFSSDQVEILYGLNPESWGGGLATEAARIVLRYGFKKLALPQIYAGADPPNMASFRVMERLGMCPDPETKLHGLSARYYIITREAYFTSQNLQ